MQRRLDLIVLILVSINFNTEVAHIVELHLLLTVSDHECPGVELEVFLVQSGRHDIVVV